MGEVELTEQLDRAIDAMIAGGAMPAEVDERIAELLGKPETHDREHLGRERRGGVGVHVDTMHRYL